MQKPSRWSLAFVAPVLSLILFVTGCASTIKTITPLNATNVPGASNTYVIGTVTAKADNVNGEFISLIRGHLEQELKNKNIFGDPQSSNSNIINVEITDYRMRGVMTRTFLGVLAGSDRVGSTVTVRSKGSNQTIGQAKIASSALLAPMNFWEALANKHAKAITEFIAGSGK